MGDPSSIVDDKSAGNAVADSVTPVDAIAVPIIISTDDIEGDAVLLEATNKTGVPIV